MVYALVLVGVLAMAQAVYSWRLSRALQVVPRLEDQVSRLTTSITMLVDTTEGCFDALSAELKRTDGTPTRKTASRQGRQRRVVGASRRGRTIKEIATEESMPEGEVAVRLSMARDLPPELRD